MPTNAICEERARVATLFMVVMLMLTTTAPAFAQSIWKCRNSRRAFLMYDSQARQAGDILTVLISERTNVQNSDQRALGRDVNADGGFSLSGALAGSLGAKAGSANLTTSANGSGDFDGSSSYSVARGLTDRITVSVIQRLPNGNLIIRGTRKLVVSGEKRSLSISGVIRPIDILADNTIESRFIADLRVHYNGEGIESRFTEQGWATRAWNKYRSL